MPVAAAAVVASALAAAPAAATFGAPTNLSAAGQDAADPQVAIEPDGDALLVWYRFDGTSDRVQARVRSASGTLGPVLNISAGGQYSRHPEVDVDPDGDAVIVWERVDELIQARTLSAGGVLGPILTLSEAGGGKTGGKPGNAEVAVDADGDAVFTWERHDGTDGEDCCQRIQTRTLSAGGTLGDLQNVSNAGQNAQVPKVAVDADGDAVFTWSRSALSGQPGTARAQARTRSAGGVFSGVQNLSAAADEIHDPEVAVEPDGDAVFAWEQSNFGTSTLLGRIQTRSRSAAGTLSAVQNLTPSGPDAEQPSLALDPTGTSVYAWSLDGTQIQTRTRNAGGVLSATQDLSAATGQFALSPEVGTDGDGDAVFTWVRSDGSLTGEQDCCFRVEARTRNSAGALGAVQALSAPGDPDLLQNAVEPQVAVNADGGAVASWYRSDGVDDRVQAAAIAPAAASFGAPLELSAAGGSAGSNEVAANAAGDAVFTWIRINNGITQVQAQTRSAAGVLSTVQNISRDGQNATDPDVAVEPDGDAVFTWVRFDGTNFRAQTRSRSAAGTLGAVQTLSDPGQDAEFPEVAVDADGDAVFAWERFDGSNSRIQARARAAGGVLSAVQNLSDPGQNARNAKVGITPVGDAVFAWQRSDGTQPRTQTRARSAAGALSAVQTLSGAGQPASDPQLAVENDGDAVFTWARFDGAVNRIQARTRSAAGALTAVQNISTAGQTAAGGRVAVDADGDAVFSWARLDGTDGVSCCLRIQTRTRSAVGALGAVQDLSDPGENADLPEVAVDDGGDAVFTWLRPEGADNLVQARERTVAGELLATQTLTDTGFDAFSPEIAVDSDGDAFAMWRRSDGADIRAHAAFGPAVP